MDDFLPLNEAQLVALEKLTTLIGADGVNHMASKGVDAFLARLNGYMQFEATLVGQVQDQIASSRLTPVPNAEPRARPLHVNVKPFEVKEGENLQFWMREVEMAMDSAMLHSERQKVALAVSKLEGRAMEWALTCNLSINDAFPTWESMKQQLSRKLRRLTRHIARGCTFCLPARKRRSYRTMYKSCEHLLLLCNFILYPRRFE